MNIQNNLYICSVKPLETEVKMARKKEIIEDNSIRMKELTKAEEQVMQVIWNIGQGFANEIMAAYPDPKPAYNTVLSIIKILENKGFVKHETFCRAHRYSPAISKEEIQKISKLNLSRFIISSMLYFRKRPSGLVSLHVSERS